MELVPLLYQFRPLPRQGWLDSRMLIIGNINHDEQRMTLFGVVSLEDIERKKDASRTDCLQQGTPVKNRVETSLVAQRHKGFVFSHFGAE